MSLVLVDANVLLDILTVDPAWYAWSAGSLAQLAEESTLAVNPIIYGEVSIRFRRIEDLEDALSATRLRRLPIPFEAAFLAGKAFHAYRRAGGTRTSVLPDFFIGAHAAVARLRLLTRDARRYRTYFPSLDLIAPE
jgi:predicted nucleic acid-binding protein